MVVVVVVVPVEEAGSTTATEHGSGWDGSWFRLDRLKRERRGIVSTARRAEKSRALSSVNNGNWQ